MAKKRRSKHEKQRRGKKPPRDAPGRADDAVDWVGGAGWQDRDSGHLTIELIMALHHDQACALHRAQQISERVASIKEVGFPDTFEIIAMPVTRKVGDEVYAQLDNWRQHPTSPTKRLLGRIGLGSENCGEVPLHFMSIAQTRPDGWMSSPLSAEAFAVLEDGMRLIGKIDAGKAQLDISNLEDEPQFVAGVGLKQDVGDVQVPTILEMLALGKTTAEATTRGVAIFDAENLGERPGLGLKIARVTRLDGQMLRMAMENSIKEAKGKDLRNLEIGLGRKDELIKDDEWVDIPESERAAMMHGDPAQVTVNGDGSPQLWEAGVITNPYWAHRVQ